MESLIVLRLLGPVEARPADIWLSPGRPQQRVILAVTAMSAGRVVPVDDLIDAIWDARPPRSARASLHALVSRLRETLAGFGGSLERRGHGYRLMVDPERVDVHRFRSLARAGREVQDAQAAIATAGEALALWRGPALADLPATAWVESVRAGLADERLSAACDRADRMLAAGLEREAAAELPPLLSAHPLAERLAGLFMIALCRCGQRAGALRVFRETRARLAGELGVEPGPELQRLHRRILAGEPELDVPGSPAVTASAGDGGPQVVPRQLPAAPPHFAGRALELATLSKLAAEQSPAAVWAVVGTAGAGKTALALQWAHQAAADFPDGQLYADLRGFGPAAAPVPPGDAIRGFLQALGVSPAGIPDSPAAQGGLYRSLLSGKRMLIVLDNARDAAQVRPLLPGSGTCPVLITSRHQLTGLAATEGARFLRLDVLPEEEARQMLAGRLGPQRVMSEPAAADGLIRHCAGLPLALAITAALIAARPGDRLERFAAELRGGPRRLDLLTTGDPAGNVREVFSWSASQLSPAAARMFSAFGVHPGPEVSAPAAASLAGVSERDARAALAELTRAHLLTEPATGRFYCHDLLRAYAVEQAGANGARDVTVTLCRALDHYLHTANEAARLLYPARDPLRLGGPLAGAVTAHLADRGQALAWLATERPVMLAATARAAAAGLDLYAWQLPAAWMEFLYRQGYWHDLATSQRIALAAASRLADPYGRAHAHLALGMACLKLGHRAGALTHTQRAIGLFSQVGDLSRQARGHITLGSVYSAQGRPAQAWHHTAHALRLFRQLGHRGGQANALTNLGSIAAELGRCAAALRCCRAALDLHSELGNSLGEAHTWDHLGYARYRLGAHAAAIACYRRALGLLREVSDPPEEAVVLTRLADTHVAAGNHESAWQARRRALAILERLPAS